MSSVMSLPPLGFDFYMSVGVSERLIDEKLESVMGERVMVKL
jgi:hypothetical protein